MTYPLQLRIHYSSLGEHFFVIRKYVPRLPYLNIKEASRPYSLLLKAPEQVGHRGGCQLAALFQQLRQAQREALLRALRLRRPELLRAPLGPLARLRQAFQVPGVQPCQAAERVHGGAAVQLGTEAVHRGIEHRVAPWALQQVVQAPLGGRQGQEPPGRKA